MPKCGVFSSCSVNFQGPFDGREGGVPGNVLGSAAPAASLSGAGDLCKGMDVKGRCEEDVSLDVTKCTCQLSRTPARTAAAIPTNRGKAEYYSVQLPTHILHT
jgi:hypothetical protein